jgi:monoamine oxidase
MKKLFKLGIVAAVVAFAYKTMAAKKEEWSGLSETEVRDKLSDKLGEKMPEEKLEKVQEKVVGTMRDMGKLREDDSA